MTRTARRIKKHGECEDEGLQGSPRNEEHVARADDPDATLRVQRLLDSPSYVQADQDAAFLQRPDMCGVRLHLDYWKTEELLRRHGIDHTIVVYGSTRIDDPAHGRSKLEAACASTSEHTGDAQARSAANIASRLARKSHFYCIARELGRLAGGANATASLPRLTVVTGGGPGIMEAANRGAFESGAASVGLNITLPHVQYPNPYLTPDLCFRLHYFAIRKLHLLERAKAAVFFPGGYGTCDELFEVLTLLQTRKIQPLPVVLVGERFWRRAVDFDFLLEEGLISREDLALFTFAETAPQIWEAVTGWYERRT
jgi:uncharacterized protein (TIGR00730 family)